MTELYQAAVRAAEISPPVSPGTLPPVGAPLPPPPAHSGGPSRSAVLFVLSTMVLAAVLFLAGFTVAAVLGLLAGSAGIGLETVNRLGGRNGGQQ